MKMHAAVVRSFDHPPRYETYDVSQTGGPHEALAEMVAVGLHPRGQGAISTEAYLAELPRLVEEIQAGRIAVRVRPIALADVESAWHQADTAGERTVLIP